MQSPSLLTPRLIVACAAVIASGSAATVCRAEVDPIDLLRGAANAVANAESVDARLVSRTTLVRDGKTDATADAFAFRTAPGGRFEFVALGDDGQPSATGFRVAGTGQVTLTHLAAARRHMVAADEDGFAAFVRSPLAARIGSGLGGLAIALLNPASTADLIENIVSSEYLGVQEVDGEQLHHARYAMAGDVSFDAWFDANGTGLVRQIRPDVLKTPGVQQMAAQYDEFDYQLAFRFEEWNAAAGLTDADIRVREPQSSLLVGSLFERPADQPHSLIGEPAPTFVLPTPVGERIDLAERVGKELVMLEFWSTDCPICVQAMPVLEELHAEYADRGFAYFAVNVGEQAGDVSAFLDSRGLEPTAVLDESSEVADAYDVSGFPLIVLIGLDGKVQVAQEGFTPGVEEKLAEQVEALLDGQDLAASTVADHVAAQEERARERERLQGLLDG